MKELLDVLARRGEAGGHGINEAMATGQRVRADMSEGAEGEGKWSRVSAVGGQGLGLMLQGDQGMAGTHHGAAMAGWIGLHDPLSPVHRWEESWRWVGPAIWLYGPRCVVY